MKNKVSLYIGIILGAFLIAAGLYFFWAPSNLAAGGISGLAIIIKALIPVIPIGIIILILDIVMFTIGFLVLGKSFGMKSLLCSLSISVITTVLEFLLPNWQPVSQDSLLVLITGSILMALGQAIVFNMEASSGGTDIVAKIISKYMHLPIGLSLMIADMLVVLFATFILGIEKGLYAALGVIITTQLIDYFIEGFEVKQYIMIIPSQTETVQSIRDYIQNELQREAIIYRGESNETKKEKVMITVVTGRKEFVSLKRQVMALDNCATITVQNLHEIIEEESKDE